MVKGLGFRVQGLGLRVEGLEFGVYAYGFWLWISDVMLFGIQNFGVRV